MEQELAYSFHLGSDKNKSKLAKKVAKENLSGTTSLSNNAIQNAKDLSDVNKHNLRDYDNHRELIRTIYGTNDIVNDVKQVYLDEFEQARIEYNTKQNRDDRKIKNYFKKVCESQNDIACEIIIELGDMDFWNDKYERYKFKMVDVYNEQVKDLVKIVPTFKVANVTIHFDETSPHMHIVGVPIIENCTRGMKKQVGKTKLFTKTSLTEIQDKMRNACIKSYNKFYEVNTRLKEKQKGRNQDINVKDMNIKDKLLKIIKNKFFIIVCIIVILVTSYIIIEEMMVDNNNEIEIIEEADDIFKKDEEENFEEKNILKDEVIDDVEEKIEEGTENVEDFENEIINDNEKIYVYITGEVNNPGIVVLPIGSRIVDAIDCAGGITQKADIMKVNLVYMLQDGMKVNIPSSIELKNNPNFEYITMSSGDEKNDSNIKKATTVDTKSESAFKVSNVNINTATQTELETLPGIGPSLALKIINYRKENGKFKSIEELKSVNGIGENKYEEIKKYIYV